MHSLFRKLLCTWAEHITYNFFCLFWVPIAELIATRSNLRLNSRLNLKLQLPNFDGLSLHVLWVINIWHTVFLTPKISDKRYTELGIHWLHIKLDLKFKLKLDFKFDFKFHLKEIERRHFFQSYGYNTFSF